MSALDDMLERMNNIAGEFSDPEFVWKSVDAARAELAELRAKARFWDGLVFIRNANNDTFMLGDEKAESLREYVESALIADLLEMPRR